MILPHNNSHDYFSIFQERALLYKNVKKQNENKGITHAYWEKNLENRFKKNKQKVFDEELRKIEMENTILSKKLIDIITKKSPTSKQKNNDILTNLQRKNIVQKKIVEEENIRLFKTLITTKPEIDTNSLRRDWNETKKYRRNIRSFNKYNQPKQELSFLTNTSNKGITEYLVDYYINDRSNSFNIAAPNFMIKKQKRKISEEHKRNISCEICREKFSEKNDENNKNNVKISKLLLDSSMMI